MHTGNRLYRSRENKLVGGVLAGFAEHFDSDPVLWRLGFIVLLFITGFMPFALVYLLAWIFIPERPLIEPARESEYRVRDDE